MEREISLLFDLRPATNTGGHFASPRRDSARFAFASPEFFRLPFRIRSIFPIRDTSSSKIRTDPLQLASSPYLRTRRLLLKAVRAGYGVETIVSTPTRTAEHYDQSSDMGQLGELPAEEESRSGKQIGQFILPSPSPIP